MEFLVVTHSLGRLLTLPLNITLGSKLAKSKHASFFHVTALKEEDDVMDTDIQISILPSFLSLGKGKIS